MKRTGASKPTSSESDDMLPEYEFDYRKARPNRFAGKIDRTGMTVTLDPDVAKWVNAVLRALIETMPKRRGIKRVNEESPD